MHDVAVRGQVLPSVVLTLLSFIAFFMNPDTGERNRGPSIHSPPPGCVSVRRNTKDMRTELVAHKSNGSTEPLRICTQNGRCTEVMAARAVAR